MINRRTFLMTSSSLLLGNTFAYGKEDVVPIRLRKAFDIINVGRENINRKPFKWNSILHAVAQELADWGVANYNLATREGHHDSRGRRERAGWIFQPPLPGNPFGRTNISECGLGGTTASRGEDGLIYPPDDDGWRHPYYSPETHARKHVDFMIAVQDPNEGHKWDFYGPWTHAAVGWNQGMFVVEYGYLPNGD